MPRIKRLTAGPKKDKKDFKIEALEEESLELKQYIVDLEYDNKVLKDETGKLSFQLSDMSEELEDALIKLESSND